MKKKPILALFLMLAVLQIALTGCGGSTNASSQPEGEAENQPTGDDVQDSTDLDLLMAEEGLIEDPATEAEQPPFDLEIICIPYSSKSNILQGVLSSLSAYIDGKSQSIASYDLTDDMQNGDAYLCLVDITFNYNIEKLTAIRVEGECENDDVTAITKYAYAAKNRYSRNSSDLYKVRDTALFCNNAGEQTCLKYLCSVTASGNDKDGYTISDFANIDPLDCAKRNDYTDINLDQASNRLFIVYEIRTFAADRDIADPANTDKDEDEGESDSPAKDIRVDGIENRLPEN